MSASNTDVNLDEVSNMNLAILNPKWWIAAGIRAIKTVAQTLAAGLGCCTFIEQIDIKTTLSMAAMAGLCSMLTSIGGLPEVDCEVQSETEPAEK